jgi:hypothetical protein
MNTEVAALSMAVGTEADLIRPPERLAGRDEPAGKKVNILIVDDKPDKLVALESVLTDLHQNIVKASSGCCSRTSPSSCSTSTCRSWMGLKRRP